MKHAALFALAALCLGACATVPRADALKLADAGQSATAGYRGQITNLNDMVDRSGALQETISVYRICNVARNRQRQTSPDGPSLCEQVTIPTGEPSPEEQTLDSARSRLVEAIELRRRALGALSDAYGAMRREAEYDAGSDLETSTRSLVSNSTALVRLFGLTIENDIAAKAAMEIPARVARWNAESAQAERLHAASARIGAATLMLARALGEERDLYVGLSQTLAERERAFRNMLLEHGLAPRTGALSRLAATTGTSLNSNVETTVAADPVMRPAALRAEDAETRARIVDIQLSYETAQQALNEMAGQHARFEAENEVSIDDVSRLIQELNALNDRIRPPPTAPPPAPAARPGGG